MKLFFLTFTFLLLSFSSSAIDCNKNKSQDRLKALIYSDLNLLNLYKELNRVYRVLYLDLSQEEKKILTDSQREWLYFIESSACDSKSLYPACNKNNSIYNTDLLASAYKNRIEFLNNYQNTIKLSRFLKVWYLTAGKLNNMHFSGVFQCTTHVDGIESCLKSIEIYDNYKFASSNCYYVEDGNYFHLRCVDKNSSILVSHFVSKEDISESQIRDFAEDLEKYISWYQDDKQKKPQYKTKIMNKLIGSYGYLSQCSSDHYRRYKTYKH